MSRSSSVPKLRTYSKDMDKLPRLTKNSWLSNASKVSDNDYLRNKQKIPKKYTLMNRDFNNAMDNIDNNLNRKLNGKNPVIYDQLNAIENNYYEMKYMLNDKINRLEKNQRKVNDFLKYSLEQDRLQNDLNSYKFNKYIKNYRDKNLSEKEYLLNMLNRVPGLIENKIGKIYLNELEENRNQKQFLDNLKDRISLEMQNQRRADYLRYKRQLNEVIQLKNNEEKEKLLLYHKIQKQKILNKMQAIKYQNQLYRYQAYNNYNNFPYYQLMQAQINNLNNNNNNKKDSLGLSMDELIKIFLFKELIGSSRMNDYQNMMNNYLLSPYMNPGIGFPGNNFYPPFDNRYRRRSEDPYYRSRDRRRSNMKYKSKSSEYGKTFKPDDKKTTNKDKKSEKKSTKKTKTKKSESSSSSSESSSSSSEESSSSEKSKSQKKSKKNEKSKKSTEEDKKSDSEEDKDESKDDNTDEENKEDSENNDDNNEDDDDGGNGEEGDGEDDGDAGGDDDDGNGEEGGDDDGNGEEQGQNYNSGEPAQTSQQPQY